jgi:peptidoglycan hydrolase-like protein with peptidoglycan-binding domain
MASGAHTKQGRRVPVRRITIAVIAGGVVVAGAVAGASYATGHGSHSASPDAAASPTTVPPPPLRLTTSSPSANATNVAPNSPITLSFSAPLAAWPTEPTITPSIPGSWLASGSTLTFTPAGGWVPYSTVKVTVPAGLAGATGSRVGPLRSPASVAFSIAPGSNLRVQQLLAELGYLPLSFTPAGAPPSQPAIDSEPTVASAVSSVPEAGTFSWRYANTPVSLQSQWAQGQPNVIDRGAIMAFESAEGLTTDGVAGPQVWTDLLAAVAQRQVTSQPYNYLMVSESLPETLQVWSDGGIIASTLANTGIPEAPTAQGTFPVYARYASTTMSGLNPNGTPYHDPGVLWVAYFNGGDAVHEFPRPGYGYPQSLGCVELPAWTAEGIWGTDPIGTLVTVA